MPRDGCHGRLLWLHFLQYKGEVDELASKLLKSGYPVESYMAIYRKHNETVRLTVLNQAMQILVVTDVAARGIDVKNISCY